MARRAEQQGERVEALLLLDTSPPGWRRRAATVHDDAARLAAQARALERFLDLELGVDERELRALDPERRIARFLDRARAVRDGLEPGPRAAVVDMLLAGGSEGLASSLAVGRACAEAAAAYRPERSWNGRVTLLRSDEADPSLPPEVIDDPALGWGAFAREVEVHRVSGDHQSMIVDPHAAGLARVIAEVLAAASRSEENGR
jgi:thioesterase domain-containing protein